VERRKAKEGVRTLVLSEGYSQKEGGGRRKKESGIYSSSLLDWGEKREGAWKRREEKYRGKRNQALPSVPPDPARGEKDMETRGKDRPAVISLFHERR